MKLKNTILAAILLLQISFTPFIWCKISLNEKSCVGNNVSSERSDYKNYTYSYASSEFHFNKDRVFYDNHFLQNSEGDYSKNNICSNWLVLFRIKINDSTINIFYHYVIYDEKRDDTIILHENFSHPGFKNVFSIPITNSRSNTRGQCSISFSRSLKITNSFDKEKEMSLLISSFRPYFHQQKYKIEDTILIC
jgi:hypothetical protein